MYILIKTDDTKNSTETIKNRKYSFDYTNFLCAKTLEEAKAALNDLQDTDDYDYKVELYKPHRKIYQEDKDKRKNFYNYLKQIIFEENKLSNSEIKELCNEYLEFLPKYHKNPPKIRYIYPAKWYHSDARCELLNKLKNFVNNYYQETIFSINDDHSFYRMLDKYFLPLHTLFSTEIGALNNYMYFTMYLIYYFNIEFTDEKLKRFWEFYKKALGLYAIIYDPEKNVMRVAKKPEKIYIQDGIVHIYYDKNHCYCNRIKVPEFVFNATKENVDTSQYNNISNRDARNIFITKIGIEKFIKYGRIIDSWEYHSDEKWMAKSEYALIDMANVFNVGSLYKNYWYYQNLYLHIKDETGEYKMESVPPVCKNIYDALKHIYKDLDMQTIENM